MDASACQRSQASSSLARRRSDNQITPHSTTHGANKDSISTLTCRYHAAQTVATGYPLDTYTG